MSGEGDGRRKKHTTDEPDIDDDQIEKEKGDKWKAQHSSSFH